MNIWIDVYNRQTGKNLDTMPVWNEVEEGQDLKEVIAETWENRTWLLNGKATPASDVYFARA